jgi:hypothetical protein
MGRPPVLRKKCRLSRLNECEHASLHDDGLDFAIRIRLAGPVTVRMRLVDAEHQERMHQLQLRHPSLLDYDSEKFASLC